MDAFLSFLSDPTEEAYRAACFELFDDPRFDFYSDTLRRLSYLHGCGKWDELRRCSETSWLAVRMSRKAHYFRALCLEQIGDAGGAESEQDFSRILISAVLRSGDGSRDRPYLVTRIEDQYDLLAVLHRLPLGQRLMEHDGQLIEVFSLQDGGEICFDVTAAMGAQRDRLVEELAVANA